MFRPLTLLVVVAATAALAGGTWWLHARAAVETAAPSTPPELRTAPIEMADHFVREARHPGRIEPARTTTLAFEQPGRVVEIRVDEGQRVAAGAVVARLDVRIRQAERASLVAERDALEAQIALATLTEERQSALEGRGFSATQALDEARFTRRRLEAEAVAVDAAIARLDVELDKALLRAPFAGTVGARHLDDGATVAAGSPVVDLLEAGRPQARIGLPPALAETLDVGSAAQLLVGDRNLAAVVATKRSDLDGRTRTTQVLFDVAPPAPAFGTLVVLVVEERIDARGFWVPTAVLETGAKGLFRVPLAVGDGEGGWERGFAAVTLLHVETERAYVDGPLPPEARLVAAGAHRVPVGAAVTLAAE